MNIEKPVQVQRFELEFAMNERAYWQWTLKRFWSNRPVCRPLPEYECPIYIFQFGRPAFVYVNPGRYVPRDWRGRWGELWTSRK